MVSLTDPQTEKIGPKLDPFNILSGEFMYLRTQTSRSLLKKVTIQTFAKNDELSCESGARRNSEFRVKR